MYDKLRTLRESKAEDDRGFTLIELLVVVVIIGILIAIAIPLYLNYQKGAHDKSAQSDLKAAVTTLDQCYTDNSNSYTYKDSAGAAVTFPATYSGTASITCGSTTEQLTLSSGTTLVVNVSSDGTSFTAAATNSGGHNNNSTAAATASAAGSGYYFYSSTAGGSIS